MYLVWLTLEELLAGVLLEEGFVNNGAREVINHQLQDRLDLFLSVTSIVCKGGVLERLVRYE